MVRKLWFGERNNNYFDCGDGNELNVAYQKISDGLCNIAIVINEGKEKKEVGSHFIINKHDDCEMIEKSSISLHKHTGVDCGFIYKNAINVVEKVAR